MAQQGLRFPVTNTKAFALKGGLDLVSPPLSIADGVARDALNFECDFGGGYSRVAGYERYDGRAAPSAAVFYKLPCTFVAAVSVGDTVTGTTSGATGKVIAVDTGAVYVTQRTGTFVSAENLQVSAVTKATTTAGEQVSTADTAELVVQYTNLAADVYRALIAAVPGSGSVLGVWAYNGEKYAFRNNAGGTAAVMHKATGSGWASVSLGYEVSFSNANTSVGDGDTLTQGAVTATGVRLVLESGTLLSGVNTGRLVFASAPSGGNFAAGAATTTGGGTLTLGGVQTAITLAPGGRYEFVNNNFGGGISSARMYGVSGVDNAFEFDGTIFVKIHTGMSADTPSHIGVHRNHLFLSFGASVQHSGIGTPYTWTLLTGAGELAVGFPVTNFQSLSGADASAALAIFCDNKVDILYGTSSADWNLVPFMSDIGAGAYTVQNVGQTYFLDTYGIRLLQASQAFGNFEQGQVSQSVTPFIEAHTGRATASYVVRKKNQYRVLFNDRYGLTLTFNANRLVGIMPFLLETAMTCACSVENSSGEEVMLLGGTDGMVYMPEKGTSFDGAAIDATLILAFNHFGSPRTRKRFRKVVYEIKGTGYSKFDASYELGYGSSEYDQSPVTTSISTAFSGTAWDAFTWDAFTWDGRTLTPSEQDVTGVAENLSLVIRSSYDYVASFTLSSLITHFTMRRAMR